ncbi:hypothetical protein DRN73_09890 [Candidatus Pacearchaeota archaeon]|nr:MAG: hypothetical protein DRN73_09890 [Candidatus Pacearchaeota archaeon]
MLSDRKNRERSRVLKIKKKILKILEKGEFSISDIARKSGLAYSTVSKYLLAMELAGKVKYRKVGSVKVYFL